MNTQHTFLPWVGENYSRQSPKLLILGESHYKRDGADRDTFTQEVIRSWAIGEQGSRKFFTTIAKVLTGNLDGYLSKVEKAKFWNEVAFYNYVQEVVDDPRDRPTDVMWEKAQKPFLEVVNSLSPDIIIVLGGHLSYHVNKTKDRLPITHFCHWWHPSSFGKFKKTEARVAFDAARQEWSKRND